MGILEIMTFDKWLLLKEQGKVKSFILTLPSLIHDGGSSPGWKAWSAVVKVFPSFVGK